MFLSYRWNDGIEDDLTLGLFNMLSSEILGSGRAIDVFLDKRRLEDGRNFREDFADALLKTHLPVVVMSSTALKRMSKLHANSNIDNLLLEWTLILELLELRKMHFCLPILIGSHNPSSATCVDSISDFFSVEADKRTVFFRSKTLLVDALPDVAVTQIIETVRSILARHGLSESPVLRGRTVRSVVQQLSLQKGVKTWDLIKDPKLSSCPASSVKNEVMRIIIGHCASTIRGILDSAEEQENHRFKSLPDSAIPPITTKLLSNLGGLSAAFQSTQALPLDSFTSTDIAAVIGSIGPVYKPYQQAFIDNDFDGSLLLSLREKSDEETLKMIEELGVEKSIQRIRILQEFKKLWASVP